MSGLAGCWCSGASDEWSTSVDLKCSVGRAYHGVEIETSCLGRTLGLEICCGISGHPDDIRLETVTSIGRNPNDERR